MELGRWNDDVVEEEEQRNQYDAEHREGLQPLVGNLVDIRDKFLLSRAVGSRFSHRACALSRTFGCPCSRNLPRRPPKGFSPTMPRSLLRSDTPTPSPSNIPC